MRIDFEEKGHVYSVNGEIASISVTELLEKHNLSPNYSGISKSKLKESADKGKEVHKDLENILNKAKYEPKTEQGKHFAEWAKENLACGVGEQRLAYELNGLIIAGTADVMGILKNGAYLIADHKNTSKFHREYVSWQVSLLDYFARKLEGEKVNGKAINWKGAEKFICFHYNPKTAEMEVVELEKVADDEMEKLLLAEVKNERYQRAVLVIDNELQQQFLKAEEILSRVELEYKKAEEQAKELRGKICELFKEQGIKSWESPSGLVKVTYVEQVDRVTVDSKKLKDKYPQIYGECQKVSQVKANVRVTIREEGEDNGE